MHATIRFIFLTFFFWAITDVAVSTTVTEQEFFDRSGVQRQIINPEAPQEIRARRDRLSNALKNEINSEHYARALSLGQQLKGLFDETGTGDTQSDEYASVLLHLAYIQRKLGMVADAERNLLNHIAIIEQFAGGYSTDLLTSLSHLAGIYHLSHRFDDAIETLQRAQHIIHRSDGVYSLDQLKIIDWIAAIHVNLNQFQDADVQQHFQYRVSLKNYGEDDPLMAPATAKLGDWYRKSRRYPEALQMYRRHIMLLLADANTTDLDLVGPLRRIASTLLLEGSCCPDEPLEQALDIVMKSPDSDRADKFEALVHLADMTLLQQHTSKAMDLYHQAWDMVVPPTSVRRQKQPRFDVPRQLGVNRTEDAVTAYHHAQRGYVSSTPRHSGSIVPRKPKFGTFTADMRSDAPAVKRSLVGAPLPLCYPQVLDLVKGSGSDSIHDYYMDLDYSVDSEGNVADLAVVESNTPPRLARYIKNMLKATRFRPRLQDGKPVRTDHLRMRQTFATSQDSPSGQDEAFTSGNTTVLEGCFRLAGL